jgi:rhodanese-related sulfurtransferase
MYRRCELKYCGGNIEITETFFEFSLEINKGDMKKRIAASIVVLGVATQAMSKAGLMRLYNLENGISDWVSQGMPTVMS